MGKIKSPYTNSLAHTTWECKYHIVFAPKFRRKEIYGKLKVDIGLILQELCRRKEAEITEAEACPDHIHKLVSIPLFDRYVNLKYKYGNHQLWCKGYWLVGIRKRYSSTYGINYKMTLQATK